MKIKNICLGLGIGLLILTQNPLIALSQDSGDTGGDDPTTGVDITSFVGGDLWNFITIFAEKIGIKTDILNNIEAGLEQLDILSGITAGDWVIDEQGAMGAVDLEAVLEQIDSSSLNSDQGLSKGSLKGIVTAKIAAGYSDSVLSKEAQEKNLEEQQKVADSIATVETLEDEANSEVITQNVMKKIAEQNNHIAAIQGSIFAANEELRTGLAINAKLSSEQLEQKIVEQNRKKAELERLISEEITTISIFAGGL